MTTREAEPERRATEHDRIIVVGAGVIGASVAHHLARTGHDVIVLDRGAPGAGVTAASFAWVGMAKSPAAAYAGSLRQRARPEFDRVLTELTAPIGLRPFGAATWEESDALTRAFVSDHQAAGHRMELLTAREALMREPGLRAAPDVVAYAPGDVGVDPVAYTRALLQSAQEHGAEVRTGTTVVRLLGDDRGVRGVLTDHGELVAKSVVVAAGTASVGIAASAGVNIDVVGSPCCLLRFSTPRPLVRGILSTPELEVRQLDDTTLLAAEDVPEGFSGDPRELAVTALAAIRRSFLDADDVRLEDAAIADRPMPADGHPLVGPVPAMPGLHLAIAHPGVILSAEIGRLVAADHAAL
ncbi:FAD-binding oxidoreductase [Microbacterium sp. ISL-59]|uniref:NAD(P)/FAD-dependent oxidoreductase n=1 Tax=Microbacterium sp. ISL-59 TaxID=2819159 RepID=UPI001BEC1E9F|nr:FAD-dependent oxidoreductase [Microbacterium sp. ISL-59]MBT2496792.1 FAD-binding oxidoreductase [Microbacterium sp. ISL-59]